ncbi:FAD-binding and (Fe-S)-binding domain-containing protein [Desulfovibrio litoralis]|uniref:FAD/FMN-containing dehydrogenase n=1 Tax=Desulfovibrio litoralis DSM 11393 TaxID=1121455 RepID=A0A1M7RTK4_9BACT|nr:FAD-binding and (Fe-S)-binding domain-containing protein [Desulfovibrio litoralis]SHN49615.1 FAD/FMN-containing dehydrogenase [Desulfovibrio litoralis DSM 11393]
MLHSGTHISIPASAFIRKTLFLDPESFKEYPEGVRKLVMELASELYLVCYNPFIDAKRVKASVNKRFYSLKNGLSDEYAKSIQEGIDSFWDVYEGDLRFRDTIIERLKTVLPADSIDIRPSARVERATDATDLRMELPLMVLLPHNTEEVSAIVRLANELGFAIVPRGGGTGLTGGAIPAKRRSVILSLEKLTAIKEINVENQYICLEAGVITVNAFKAAATKKLLFTVDPASKAASSIGGNISENSGGPMAFEYGSAIDCILSYRMVLPDGKVVDIERQNHPRHKIMPDETAVFIMKDSESGKEIKQISLSGTVVRAEGLGKDVTNKTLGGLPGVQKEGVDGIITEACFVLYPKPEHMQVMVLEFYGQSMRTAMNVIKEIVELRNAERENADKVKITALEEFNSKYVRVIEYKKKSHKYEGEPISVLILQLDSNDKTALEEMSNNIIAICEPLNEVDAFLAKDEKEAELFWEDRHRLSAISKRTSGFKINEDIVIPMEVIPEFSVFLERLNVECLASAFRDALRDIAGLEDFPNEDKELNQMFSLASRLMQDGGLNNYENDLREANLLKRLMRQGKRIPTPTFTLDAYVEQLRTNTLKPLEKDEEGLELQCSLFFSELVERYPYLAEEIYKAEKMMQDKRVIVASHMHAGDGNCHVNIPVNSNDAVMLRKAELVAGVVMSVAQKLGGAVTGEHGIGITKIAFLSDDEMNALKAYKKECDPNDLFNPAKLTQKELPTRPFTFSFNKLIQDINQSGLREQDRETLASLLKTVQVCNRCGKCKDVCPMHYPDPTFFYYPRNKNISIGALVEAIFYSNGYQNTPDPKLLAELLRIMEHCTGCGKCMAVCPVKINSAEVALKLRSFVAERKAGGHPIKTQVLNYLAHKPEERIPKMAKMAAFGQHVQEKLFPLLQKLPESFRSRINNPLFNSKTPPVGNKTLADALRLMRGNIFLPKTEPSFDAQKSGALPDAVLYFPGCGASLFYRNIALSSIQLLLMAGYAVIMPDKHLCCGYPLLSSGDEKNYERNRQHNNETLKSLLTAADKLGFEVTHLLTACGTCRDSIGKHQLKEFLPENMPEPEYMDVIQLLMANHLDLFTNASDKKPVVYDKLLYHAACHSEWVGVAKMKAAGIYAKALEKASGSKVNISPGCCGESGLGALSSPEIYNYLRKRKSLQLFEELNNYTADTPIIVGCPSCKIGISRILLEQGDEQKRVVQHSLEYLANRICPDNWRMQLLHSLKETQAIGGLRYIDPYAQVVLSPEELSQKDD